MSSSGPSTPPVLPRTQADRRKTLQAKALRQNLRRRKQASAGPSTPPVQDQKD